MRDLPLAQKYASAIFHLAVDRQKVGPVVEEMGELSDALTSDEQVAAFFADPSVPTAEQSRVFANVAEQLSLSDECLGLCEVMIANGRMALLPDVNRAVVVMAAAFEKRTDAHVSAARELLPEEQDRLRSALGKLTEKTVTLHVDVDRSLIGGVVVRVGNTVIDGSVTGRLRAFAEQME